MYYRLKGWCIARRERKTDGQNRDVLWDEKRETYWGRWWCIVCIYTAGITHYNTIILCVCVCVYVWVGVYKEGVQNVRIEKCSW